MTVLIYILLSIIFQISMIYAVKSLSNSKIENKIILIIGIVIFAILYKLIVLELPTELGTMISIFYTIIIIKLCTKLSMKNLLFYMIVVWIIAIIVDILVMFLSNFFTTNEENKEIFKFLGTLMIVGAFLACGNKIVIKKINYLKNLITKLHCLILVSLLCYLYILLWDQYVLII